MVNLALFTVYQSQENSEFWFGRHLLELRCILYSVTGVFFRHVFEDLKKPNKLTLRDDVNSNPLKNPHKLYAFTYWKSRSSMLEILFVSHVYPNINDKGTVQSKLSSLYMGWYSITRIICPLQCYTMSVPGLHLGSAAQSSMILARARNKDALPAFSAICVYIQGKPAQSLLIKSSLFSDIDLKIKDKKYLIM